MLRTKALICYWLGFSYQQSQLDNRSVKQNGGVTVPESVLEAIKDGNWDFEPHDCCQDDYDKTGALPGTREKLDVLAERLESGLPLWHPEDRQTYDDTEET